MLALSLCHDLGYVLKALNIVVKNKLNVVKGPLTYFLRCVAKDVMVK